jgi:predicted aconitase with swiveling domain
MTTKIALGAVVMRIPAITDLDRDPFALIHSGDILRVDGERGTVERLAIGEHKKARPALRETGLG